MYCPIAFALSFLLVTLTQSSVLKYEENQFEEIFTTSLPNFPILPADSVVFSGDNLSVQLSVNGTVVQLELAKPIVAEDILVITKDSRNSKIVVGSVRNNCHFHSKTPLISAALSNCTGSMEGLIIMGNKTYVVQQRPHQSSVIYPKSDKKWKRSKRTPTKELSDFCGLNSEAKLAVSEDITKEQLAETGESLAVLKYKTDEPVVELGVFADQELYAKFAAKYGAGEAETKLQDFLVTVLNNVQMLYKQPGLVPNVNFKIVRMEIFKTQPDSLRGDLHSNGEASSYLEYFCRYQTDRPDRNYDHGLLFTGYDIHRGDDHSISGISKLGGLCHLTQACTLAEGLDFTSVYITAHELGHSLGMAHDEPACGSNYIMSGSLGPGKVTWSECSQTQFSKFQEQLNSYGKNCMATTKHDATVELPVVKPGQRYNADLQCELIHGVGYKQILSERFSDEKICSMLWCSKIDSGRIITSHPALEGTTCGTNKFCILGKCVPSDIPIIAPPAVNGGWGGWTKHDCNSCSCQTVTEGIPLVKSTRNCDNPTPTNGGTPCNGLNIRGVKCSATCSSGKSLQAYLDDICTKLRDSKPESELIGTGVQLNKTPKRACKVFCTVKSVAESSTVYRTYNDLLPDGTACGAEGEEKFCLEGNCLPLSCNKNAIVDSNTDCPTSAEECPLATTTAAVVTVPTTLASAPAVETTKAPIWDNWVSWTSCSVTCGEGKRTRKRFCIGVGCSGQSDESENCAEPECPSMSEWSDWSGCSVTCEKGVQLRHRTCHGAETCVGHTDERKNCRLDDCPVWSDWESWTGCSVSCDRGSRGRSRTCMAGSCIGSNKESEACVMAACNSGPPTSVPLNSPAPVVERPAPAVWNEWQSWGPCNCGNPGAQKRSRSCGGISCVGIAEESQTCPADHILCAEKWASWTEWSTCTETCGYSVRKRTRTCLGDSCPGVADMSDVCNTTDCPKDSSTTNWSQWGSWAYCSATCGSGFKVRRRYCLKSDCTGDTEDKVACVADSPCKPPWSAWSRWSDCRPHCGLSSQSRFRTCLGPGICDGSDSEEQTCVYRKCDEGGSFNQLNTDKHSDWSEWSSCSLSCGSGRKTRSKSLNGNTISDSNDCYSDCEIGNWLSWGDWTPCTRSCGTGWRRRTRQCNGNKCGDNMSDRSTCNIQSCD